MGYIDIHSHVLHGLDDGAKGRAESIQMLEIAAGSGTTDIVATPHANSEYRFDPEQIDFQIRDLSASVDIRIHRGCDFHLQFSTIEDALAHPQKYTINGNGYLLVEFSDFAIFPNTDEIFLQMLAVGMRPIITHPERNPRLQGQPDDLARWVELGCYIQVTAGSCTGTFGRTAQASAFELISRGLVHFIASDAHDTRHRRPSLKEAYSLLEGRWGAAIVRPLFVDNPAAVLTGEGIEMPLPAASAPRRRQWFRFWG
jgi:protein-tyrosine phosphatase